MATFAQLRPGDPHRLGGLDLLGRLGEGGQGVVYLAVGDNDNRVAVKWLRPDLSGDQVSVERFLREVQVAQQVAPFCTAAVLGTGIEQDRPYIISEFIEGPSLHKVVQDDGPRTGSVLHRLAIGTATALAAIHEAGIVHRDFKPANVIIGADGPRVIDFGIARALDATSTITGMVVGTPAYMSPEQIMGHTVGPAADMFSWACTMVFAACGQAPFGSDTMPAVINRVLNRHPDLGMLDEQLREVVGACLAKDPAQRPAAEQVIMRLLRRPTNGPAPTAGPMPGSGPMAGGFAPPAGSMPGQVSGGGPASGPGPASGAGPAPVPSTGAGGPSGPGTGFPQHSGILAQAAAEASNPPPPTPTPTPAPPFTAPSGPHSAPHSAPQSGPHPGPHSGPQSGAPSGHGSGPYGPYTGFSAGPSGQPPQTGSSQPPWQPPYGPTPTPAHPGRHDQTTRSRTRAPILAGVTVAVALLILAGVIVYIQVDKASLAGPVRTPSPGPSRSGTSASASPSRPAKPPAVPTTGTKIKIPGASGMYLYEDPRDAIVMTSYEVDPKNKDQWTDYARNSLHGSYTRYSGNFESKVSPDGRYLASRGKSYSSDDYDFIVISDRQTGDRTTIKTVKEPLITPIRAWSKDGGKILLNVEKESGDDWIYLGFMLVDMATKKATRVSVSDPAVRTTSFGFDGDDGGTVNVYGDEKNRGLRFFDADGRATRSHPGIGTLSAGTQDIFSPSGKAFVTNCPNGGDGDHCIWDASSGERLRKFSSDCDKVLGFYDESHLYCWEQDNGVNDEIQVVDFAGKLVRKLVEVPEKIDFSPTFTVNPSQGS
ncbi:serine/threonine-protein kinase [Nonomuraea phyllanthi]|uniref:serine/threonine-protein kinase n=1 Tax=Nonomuraea phyllanthi TaxID=2219224 RepID=UPI001D14864A|nr:serine/threonine-protein kinase [Nonomuraea phyllanthi]